MGQTETSTTSRDIERDAVKFAPMFSGHGSAYEFLGEDRNTPTPPVSYREAWFRGIDWIFTADTIGGDAQIYHIPTGDVTVVPPGNPGINTKVISAFPGTGKTRLHQDTDLFVLDSDSSRFSWVEQHGRDICFPDNYMRHAQTAMGITEVEYIQRNLDSTEIVPIRRGVGFADIVLVSSHDLVRKALVTRGIDYTLVFPDRSLKDEYIERFKERGSPQGFIDLLDTNWDKWISELESQEGCTPVRLQQGQFLSDVVTTC